MTNIRSVLDSYALPPAIIATGDSVCGCINMGPDRRLDHPRWIVRTADPAKIRDADVEIDLDPVIGPGGVRCTDADALTARIVALEAIRGQYFGSLSAVTMPTRLRNLFWLFRWRRDLGTASMNHVTPVLFDDFCERLRRGQAGLIDLDARLERFTRNVDRRGWSDYCRETVGGAEADFEAIATELGISRTFLVNSPAYAPILQMIADHDPAMYKRAGGGDVHAVLEDLEEREDAGTIAHPEKALLPWRWLHDLSAAGALAHDPLTFDPFDRVSFAARVRTITRSAAPRADRTGTPDPEHWLALLDHAARWVLDYAEPIIDVCEAASEIHREMATASSQDNQGRVRRYVPTAAHVAYRARIQRLIDEKGPTGVDAPVLVPAWRWTNDEVAREDGAINLEQALVHVAAACIILVGGLSARRRGELESMRAGCAEQDPFGNWWLSVYIEKTIRDLDRIPVPSSVAYAVRILERLSATARQHDAEGWLARIHRPVALINAAGDAGGPRPYLKTRLDLALDGFWRMAAGPNANVWSFKPHQLRRAFSVYYYHGNRFSTLDALSRFLRHFDPEMTRRYITEAIPGALMRLREIIEARGREHETARQAKVAAASLQSLAGDHEDVRQDAYVERMVQIFDGVEDPIGHGTRDLRGDLEMMVEKARTHVRLDGQSNVSPDREREALIDQLRALAPFRSLDPHPGRHAHCNLKTGDEEAAAKAVCLSNRLRDTGEAIDAKGPDYAHCSTADCLGCPFGVAFSENVAVIKDRIVRVDDAARKAGTAGGREAAQNKLALIKGRLDAARTAARTGGR